jgi:large subunit ribosomal protein L6
MSRVGKKPIEIPEGVKVERVGGTIKVSGPKGVLKLDPHPRMKIEIEENTIRVVRKSDSKLDRSLHGLTRSLVANMITGITEGYEKVLEVEGMGYKAKVEGNALNLQLGFSHPVVLAPPEGITFEVESVPRNPDRPSLQCLIHVRGVDKQAVGEIAAKVRSFRKPEPYKGTGIKYRGEYIRRKSGKSGV